MRWFSTLVAKNTNFDDAKLVVPAADLDSWMFQARDEGPDEGTKQQNRSEIGLDGVQRRRKVDPRRGSKTKWFRSRSTPPSGTFLIRASAGGVRGLGLGRPSDASWFPAFIACLLAS